MARQAITIPRAFIAEPIKENAAASLGMFSAAQKPCGIIARRKSAPPQKPQDRRKMHMDHGVQGAEP